MRKKIELKELRVGDLIKVVWLDASEMTEHQMDIDEEDFDTMIHTYGIFGGIRGSKVRHIIVIKEVFPNNAFHSNIIPVALVVSISRFVAKAARKPVRAYIRKCIKEGKERFV